MVDPTWSEATGWQRVQMVVALILACIFTVGLFIGGMLILGRGADNLVRYHTDLDVCRKNAPTAYEYHECR